MCAALIVDVFVRDFPFDAVLLVVISAFVDKHVHQKARRARVLIGEGDACDQTVCADGARGQPSALSFFWISSRTSSFS